MKTKLLLIFALAILSVLTLAPATAQDCSSSSNAYLTFTDYAEQNTLEITQGDSVRLTSVAYSYDGPLWYEKLEIVNELNIFTKYESGTYYGNFHLFTDTTTFDTSILEPGTYTIKFTASTLTDCSLESETLTLIVNPSQPIEEPDTQCPIVDITYPQDGSTHGELISTANFNINEDVKLESCSYNLNGNTYTIQNCINGSNTLSNLITQEGSNTLTVYATDNSSNTCSDSVTFNIEIPEPPEEDDQCPIVSMISPLDGEIYEDHLTEASFSINEENELDVCEYTINGVTETFNCQKSYNTIPIQTIEGSNTLTIYIEDNSSNVCPVTTNFNIEIPEPPEEDDQCPIVDITFPEDGSTYDELIENANFNVNEDVKLESCSYDLNGQTYEFENCINGTNSLSNLLTQEGSNALTVYATDNSSNTCSDSVNFNIDIPEEDNECPEINILYPEENKIYNTLISTARYTLSDENEIESCYYNVNGQSSERYSCNEGTNHLYNLDFVEGSNTLEIFSKDEFDNECSASVNFEIELEQEPPEDYCPEVNIISPIDGKTYFDWKNDSIFTVNEDHQLNSCSYTLNGQTFNIPNCVNGTNYLSDLNPLNGLNTLKVSATDNASQTCYDEITFNINITDEDENETENETDNQCPIVDITFPTNSETYDELISTANFDVNEDVKLESCSYDLNGQTFNIPDCINGSNTLTDLITQEGSNTLTVYATDNSSNTCSDSVTFNIELDDDEDDEEENETCDDCCVEPDYYDYYYEENKTIKDYFWKTADKVKNEEITLNLEFNPRTAWERFINWLKRVFS